jgi:predicted transcriptional regulator
VEGVNPLSDLQRKKELPEEKELLDRLLSSEVKAELLALFHKSPGVIDRIDGVARRIGRTASEIEADVKALIDLGILLRKRFGKSEVIYFNRNKDREIQQIISNGLKRGGG